MLRHNDCRMLVVLVISLCIHFGLAQICASSQYFNGQRCAPCQANCICQADNTCDSCMAGYTFDSQFQNCLQCPVGVDSVNIGCQNCCTQLSGAAFICSECQVGSNIYLIGGQCIQMIGCSNVDTNGVCTTCSTGYYLQQGKCQQCDVSCATCYDSSLCLTCNTNYYNGTNVNAALCSICPASCSSCSSASACNGCASGYRLSGSNCLACSANCLACNSTACSKCSASGALVGSVCYLCTDATKQGSTGCISCTGDTSRTYCTACSNGFYLDLATKQCFSCVSKFSFAALCNSTTIFQCVNDYASNIAWRYHLVNNNCVSNAKLCKSVSNLNGDCSSCYFEGGSYYSLQGSSCAVCSVVGCLSYSTGCACLSCQNGYQFVNNQCQPCQNLHCNQCASSIQSCDVCAPSYGRYSSACVACIPSNCYNCDGDYTVCSACIAGFYLANANCYQCQAHCLTCSSNQKCTSCDSSTYLQANGRCKTLPANCVLVDPNYLGQNVAVCKKCAYGYQIMSGNCYSCSSALFNMAQCQDYHCPNYYAALANEIRVGIYLGLLVWMTVLLF